MTVKSKAKKGSCRIIGGKWRGRVIKFDDAEGLRPTTDRIRETVFNWLQPYVQQSCCLDVFAGSGVLGFEALSRGGNEVVFIEKNSKTVKKLKENIAVLGADSASVQQHDALDWLGFAGLDARLEYCLERRFDLVFLDPPFHTHLLAKSCALLDSSGCLADDAIIYVEHAVDEDIVLPERWSCLREKSAGQVSYKLFERRG